MVIFEHLICIIDIVALRLGKTEREESKLLSGLHNITLKSLSRLEAELGVDIIVTPKEACKKYKTTEYVSFKVYVPVPERFEERFSGYDFRVGL